MESSSPRSAEPVKLASMLERMIDQKTGPELGRTKIREIPSCTVAYGYAVGFVYIVMGYETRPACGYAGARTLGECGRRGNGRACLRALREGGWK